MLPLSLPFKILEFLYSIYQLLTYEFNTGNRTKDNQGLRFFPKSFFMPEINLSHFCPISKKHPQPLPNFRHKKAGFTRLWILFLEILGLNFNQ